MQNIADRNSPRFHSFFGETGVLNFGVHGAVVYQAEFFPAHYSDVLFSCHEIPFPLSLNSAAPVRRSSFFAGRYSAQQAIRLLRATGVVHIGERGNPLWPTGIVGSITHSRTYAICALSTEEHFCSIGIDLEDWMTPSTASVVCSGILFANEVQLLQKIEAPFEIMLTLAFSAKESLFKALYPIVRRYFDFHSAQLLEVCLVKRSFSISITEDLCSSMPSGRTFDGRFVMRDKAVLTSIFVSGW